MPRVLPALLALSVAANAVFLARAVLASRDTSAHPVSAGASHPAPAKNTPPPAFPAADWASLQNGDASSLAFLRQLGFSDVQLRAVSRALVDARYAGREKALRNTPEYWHSNFRYGSLTSQPWKDPVAARTLKLQKETELRALLGEAYEPADPRLRRYTGFLPFEKAWQLHLIQEDYQLIHTGNARTDRGHLQLPNSTDSIVFIQQQQRADIEAVLTPDELHAYDLRFSPTARFLQTLAGFDATEQEYLALYELRKPLEGFRDTNLRRNSPEAAALQERQTQIEQQIRSTLGESRYAEYQRAQSYDYRLNHELTTRLNLPPETALAGYRQMQSLMERAQAFRSLKDSDPARRKAFDEELRREADAAFTRLYGKEAYALARDRILQRLPRGP